MFTNTQFAFALEYEYEYQCVYLKNYTQLISWKPKSDRDKNNIFYYIIICNFPELSDFEIVSIFCKFFW